MPAVRYLTEEDEGYDLDMISEKDVKQIISFTNALKIEINNRKGKIGIERSYEMIELLDEFAFDFMDPSFEKHFFQVHNDIVKVINQRKSEEAKRLIEEDVLEVKRKLEEFYGES